MANSEHVAMRIIAGLQINDIIIMSGGALKESMNIKEANV